MRFFLFILILYFSLLGKSFAYLDPGAGSVILQAILGFIGPLIYNVMYTFVTFKSNIITCQERLVKKKKLSFGLSFGNRY